MEQAIFQIASPASMLQLGEALAALLKAGDIIAIDGTLGAGKTVLSKGILGGLGFSGEVTSPTFTIANHYDPPLTRLPAVHADVYRLDEASDLDELGLFDGCDAGGVLLVEWASKFVALSDAATVHIKIESVSGNMRAVSITGDKHLLEGLHGLGFAAHA